MCLYVCLHIYTCIIDEHQQANLQSQIMRITNLT